MALKWRGPEVLAKMKAAARVGINATMAECVIFAKSNHPGWKNRTGTAEGSIRIVDFAEERGTATVGRWGSVDVNYMGVLEYKHGSALRNAADQNYPHLAGHIREAFAS